MTDNSPEMPRQHTKRGRLLAGNMSLAEIASSYPALTRVLDRFDLDYCCSGRSSLEAACQLQGLDIARVLTALASEPIDINASPAWMNLPPAALVDHLESIHHAYLKQELPRLSTLAAKVMTVHGERHPRLAQISDRLTALRAALEPHMLDEEQVLFPRIRALAATSSQPQPAKQSLTDAIAPLQADHTTVRSLLQQLRALTDGYQPPADTCASTQALMAGLAELEADIHQHLHKENNHLFPAVMGLEHPTCIGEVCWISI